MQLKWIFPKIKRALIMIGLAFLSFLQTLHLVFASTDDITSVVLEWMPLIITFAMLGMVLGLLKKFGKLD
jgi:hypothetical protein